MLLKVKYCFFILLLLTISVKAQPCLDTDGDGICNTSDFDDDNDGILDVNECMTSNFFWSSAPTAINNTQATGTINGIAYTYTSNQTLQTEGTLQGHYRFPNDYGIPNTTNIMNTAISSNTLTFAQPITNPILIFASIGAGSNYVSVTLSDPFEILWSQDVTKDSETQITGNEGFAVIRMNGTFSQLSFDYLKAEYRVNFYFGADFATFCDTDGDGTPDYLDEDSDDDGCTDAVEGGGAFKAADHTNGILLGNIDASGIPVVANGGQAVGSSTNANVQDSDCPCANDNDNDGICDGQDLDDDNDGILDSDECQTSDFYWSDAPTVSGTQATGTINGIGYTYTSSITVETTPSIFQYNTFPASYGIPNIKVIKNRFQSQNTVTFAQPIENPILVFSSIGGGPTVPIRFSDPVEVLFQSGSLTITSPTELSGKEADVILRMNGTFTQISFDYLADENYVNFCFGADFLTYCDTDGDGTPDYLDDDSDDDGCVDAVEGGATFVESDHSSGVLNGNVDANGVPVVANGGQASGTSTDANAQDANCILELIQPDTLYICQGDSVTIDAEGVAVTQWSGTEAFTLINDSTISAKPTVTTTYHISSFTKNQDILVNGGFETNGGTGIKDAGTLPGWNTTATDNKVEIWANGFIGHASYAGNFLAELNANMQSALYQDVATTPGEDLMWAFAHKARGGGVETVDFEVGPPGGPYQKIGSYGDISATWGYYEGVYKIPAGQNTTRFYFSSTDPGGSGNLMDGIEFNTVNEQKDSVVVVVRAKPIVNLGADTTFCVDDGLTLDAENNGASFLWNDASANQTLNVSSTGTYFVEVTGTNGCIGRDTISVVDSVCFESLCGGDINFNSWSQAGIASEGNWVVSGDGKSVNQTINGNPTFYTGNTDYLNVKFSGKMRTDFGADDDWMGMVFGYQGGDLTGSYPITLKTYVFGWKQKYQNHLGRKWQEGFSLIEVNTTINNSNDILNAFSVPYIGSTVLDSLYGTGLGYQTGVDNDISIEYTASKIKVYVNDNLIFDVDGCFDAGKIGFYNWSQPDVTYSDFNYQFIGNIDMADDTLCLGDQLDVAVFEGPSCNRNSYYPVGAIFDWDLKDGTTLTQNKVKHVYSNSGEYDVQLIVSDGQGCADTSFKKVYVADYPIVNLGNDTTICTNENISFDAQNLGSSYLWSTTENTQQISVNSPGEYRVDVTNWGLCTSKDTIILAVNDLPIVDLGNDVSICSGDSVVLDAGNSGLNFSWNTLDDTQSITINSSGTYGIEVSDSIGCMGSDSLNLVVNALPIVNLGNDTAICIGESVTLDAQNAGLNYSWNTNVNSQTISVSSSGTYGVEVRDAIGCLGSDSMELFVNTLPVVDVGNDTIICFGENVSLDAGNIGLNYLWNEGAIAQTIVINSTGIYGVEVRDSIGCLGSDSLELTVNPMPYIDLGNDTSICIGESVELNALNPGFNYSWNNGKTSQIITISTSGNYEVIVSDEIGCNDTSSMDLTVNPLPIVDLGNDTVICTYSSIILDAQNEGLNYDWSTGSTSQTIEVKDENSYSVEVRDEIGCLGEDEIFITIELIDDPYFEKEKLVCEGDSITLEPDFYNNYQIFWETDRENSSLTVSETGIYTSIVEGDYCKDTFEINVTKVDTPDAVIIDLSGQKHYCFEYETTTLQVNSPDANVEFDWDNLERSNELLVDSSGNYALTVSNEYCLARYSYDVVEYCPGRLFIPDAFTPNKDGLNEVFMPVSNGHLDGYEFRIYNRWGVLIYYTNVLGEGWDGTISNNLVQSDVYVYKITYNSTNEHGGTVTEEQVGRVTLLK